MKTQELKKGRKHKNPNNEITGRQAKQQGQMSRE
jgi:hypothetical protein